MTTFKIAVQIGAAVTGGFASAIKGSTSQLNQLGSSINTLKRQQSSIKKVELGEASVGKARVAYNAAVGDVVRLRREMAKTGPPSQQLSQSFDRAKQNADRLSASLSKERERLQQARQALRQAGVSTDNLADDNRRLGQSVETLTKQYGRLGKAVNARNVLNQQRAELRGQLFDAAALGATVAVPLKIAIDFEQSIAKLGAITASSDLSDEVNAQNQSALEIEAKRLGRETQFTASQTADAMTFLGMAGFNPDQILGATGGVLNLAKAAGTDLSETADISSNILSGFGLDATQDMERVGDVLAATFTTTNTTLNSLGETMKFVAPVARDAGGSVEEVAAMVGLLGNVGIQGSRAGTALRATFLRLSAPTGGAKKAIESLGIEVADLDGNLRPVPELLKDIALATKGIGSVQRTSLIKTIFGEEAASGVSELLNQSGLSQFDAAVANAANGGQGATALQATFAKLEAPLGAASKQLTSLGIQALKTDGQLRPVPDIIRGLSEATAHLGESARDELLSDIFGQDQAVIGRLLDQASTNSLDAELIKLDKANGTQNRIAKQMGATTLGSLQRLGSALESIAISVGSLLLPTMTASAELLAKVATSVSGFADQFPLLTTVVVGATVGLIGLRIATIAGAFAYTFMKGAVLSLRTAYLALTSGMVLQKTTLVAMNIIGRTSAVVMGLVTAAQWAWNIAMTANPIGLIVVGIGALIGAGVLLIKNWDNVKTFFAGLWSDLKKMTGAAVDWLLEKMDVLMAPFTFFFQAGKTVGNAIGRFFSNDEEATVSVGSTLGDAATAATNLAALDGVEAASLNRTHHQSIAIDAPITINASPGMDEVAIAQQVRRELEQRQDRTGADRRGQLFDDATL